MALRQSIDPHQWVAKYADILYSYALTRLDSEEQASDLVQETFLAALEGLATFKGESAEQTWLMAILKYKVIEVYRKRNSGLRAEPLEQHQAPEAEFFEPDNGHWKAAYSPQAFGLEAAGPDPLAQKELAAILSKCLKKLPALWYSVFCLKHVDETETAVICAALKVSNGNFWVIMHRAKLHLRACIQREWI
jgi:RNA polymerase sigma-70 factor (TIGR02943 family)